MDKLELDPDGRFTVKDSAFMNAFIGVLLILFCIGLLVSRNYEAGNGYSEAYLICFLLLASAVYCFVRADKKKVYIVIDTNGIFYQGKQVTNWTNFRNSYIKQEEYRGVAGTPGLEDKFKIVVLFYNPADGITYMYQMSTSDGMDKSEYDIITAISHFSGISLSYEIF